MQLKPGLALIQWRLSVPKLWAGSTDLVHAPCRVPEMRAKLAAPKATRPAQLCLQQGKGGRRLGDFEPKYLAAFSHL